MNTPNDPCRSSDPVHEEGGQWWFWEETWADRQGPFPTRAAAVEACNRYSRWLHYGPDDNPQPAST